MTLTRDPDAPHATQLGTRWGLITIGGIAGLAHWAVFDLLGEIGQFERLVLILGVGVASFFAALMMMLGPVRLGRAIAGAAMLAVLAAGLTGWASLRFHAVEQFVDESKSLVAVVIMSIVLAPFIAAYLREPGGWRRYPLLFDTTWESVLRYVAGILFTGLVWGLLHLCDTFLGLVGVTIIDDLIDLDPMPWVISGVALGLGLSVFYELRDYISADLFVQLLRLLMPIVLVVVVIFIVALPFRGLSGLLGGLSPAVTLAGVSLAGVVLISAAVHGGAGGEVQHSGMRLAARALGVVIAVPAVLAVYAVMLRIGQYGLTPDRIAALVAALVILAYSASYAVLSLLGRDWMGRLRQSNLMLAGLVVLVSALWLTPVLNAERMSVTSQLERARAGAPADALPIWEMIHDWGRAGERGVAVLRDLETHPEHEGILAHVARAETLDNKYQFNQQQRQDALVPLQEIMPLRPEGVTLPEGSLDALPTYMQEDMQRGCARKFDDGLPGCVIIVAPFNPARDDVQAIALWRSQGHFVNLRGIVFNGAQTETNEVARRGITIKDEDIQRALRGDFEIVPVERKAVQIGDQVLFPYN